MIYGLRVQLGFHIGKLRCRLGVLGSAWSAAVVFDAGKHSPAYHSAVSKVFDSLCADRRRFASGGEYDYQAVRLWSCGQSFDAGNYLSLPCHRFCCNDLKNRKAQPQNKQYASVEESTEENVYVVKDYKGMIAIFYNDNQIPIQIFNIYTDTLPEEDAKKIKAGIKLTSKELESFISDYTS